MKPNFALSLSFEGISLFHRADRGWHLVGEVALDAADFAGELQTLRKTAKALEKRGVATKLILPNGQIRYLDVNTGKVGDAERIEGARQALDGATPYAVDELAISASAHGAITHVAAVAKETLQEAEAFAIEHKFNPVCFVAVPDNGDYLGEPFFGVTAHAQSLPDGGADLGPEQHPVRVVGTAKPAIPPAPPPLDPDAKATPEPEAAPKPAPETKIEPKPATVAPTPSFHSSRASKDGDASKTESPAPRLSGVSRLTISEPSTAPSAPAAPVADIPDSAPALPDTPGFAASDFPEDDPKPAPRERVAAAFATVRDLGQKLPRKVPGNLRAKLPTKLPGNLSLSLPKRRKASAAEVEAPAEVVQETLVAEQPGPATGQESEARRMTVFGARDAIPVGGKPKYLGLILTVLLLLFLAAIAVWASVFTDDGLAGLFQRKDPAPVVVTQRPAPDAETAPVIEEPITASLPQVIDPTPQVADDAITDSAEAEALANAQSTEPSHREAEAHYAVTGIWLKGPDQPSAAPALNNDNLYVASIDSAISAQDAVLIPAPERALTDTQPRSLSAPAAAGTTFAFDERGLVIATTEGAVTPDGITVYSGRPPVVPSRIPERSAEPPEVSETQTRLATLRPRARPDNLLENSERVRNGGLTVAELASKRPRARPATAKHELEQDETPTLQAIKVSRKPKGRPKNFDTLVETAMAALADNAAGNVVVAAAAVPAPAAHTPRIPTTASVARQATVKNVINLRKVNLIGVYGKPSSRRALVRLASGRYKKVKVGDRIDGGKVSAIGESELRYTKNGRNVVLKMPKT